jgi:hypothetical protein
MLGRMTDRTYIHPHLPAPAAAVQGLRGAGPSSKLFEEPVERGGASVDLEWTEEVVGTTRGGRKQVKLQIARRAVQVRYLVIGSVAAKRDRLETVLELDRREQPD